MAGGFTTGVYNCLMTHWRRCVAGGDAGITLCSVCVFVFHKTGQMRASEGQCCWQTFAMCVLMIRRHFVSVVYIKT